MAKHKQNSDDVEEHEVILNSSETKKKKKKKHSSNLVPILVGIGLILTAIAGFILYNKSLFLHKALVINKTSETEFENVKKEMLFSEKSSSQEKPKSIQEYAQAAQAQSDSTAKGEEDTDMSSLATAAPVETPSPSPSETSSPSPELVALYQAENPDERYKPHLHEKAKYPAQVLAMFNILGAEFYARLVGGVPLDKIFYQRIFSQPNMFVGHFVEVGVVEAVRGSTTYFLEKHMGWTGFLLDGAPANQERFSKDMRRLRCKSFHGAVCPKAGTLQFIGEGSYAARYESFTPDSLEQRKQAWRPIYTAPYKINCQPMQYYLDNFPVKGIDFMSIDLNGDEHWAIGSINFTKASIGAIHLNLENSRHKERIYDTLEKKGFCHGFSLESHEVWLAEPKLQRKLCVNPEKKAGKAENVVV